MPITLAYLKWQADYGDKPTPPAASAAMKKPEKVVDLADAFRRVYSERPRRIA